MMARQAHYTPQQQQPFVAHLIELRNRLLRILSAVGVVFLLLSPFAGELYGMLAKPLISSMPNGGTMIATEVASPFLTPFKFAFVFSCFLVMPFILHQFWGFVAPGLYKEEKKVAYPLLFSSVILFYLGMLFAYFAVFPLVFGFLVGVAPEGVTVMTDISKYLDFVLKLFFAFGLAFEVPVATILIVKAGISTPDDLARKRPYIIIAAFVLGMLFTPPDVVSQLLLAIPIWLLFELGLVFARKVEPPPASIASE